MTSNVFSSQNGSGDRTNKSEEESVLLATRRVTRLLCCRFLDPWLHEFQINLDRDHLAQCDLSRLGGRAKAQVELFAVEFR